MTAATPIVATYARWNSGAVRQSSSRRASAPTASHTEYAVASGTTAAARSPAPSSPTEKSVDAARPGERLERLRRVAGVLDALAAGVQRRGTGDDDERPDDPVSTAPDRDVEAFQPQVLAADALVHHRTTG